MTSIHAHFTHLCDAYLLQVRGLSFSQSAMREKRNTLSTKDLLIHCEKLWEEMLSARLFSSNESLEEYDASVLELLWIPFMIADMYQQYQEECPPSRGWGALSSSSNNNNHDNHNHNTMIMGGDGRMHSSSPGGIVDPVLQRSVYRQEALSRAKKWARCYLGWMENIEIFTEEERRKAFPGVFDSEGEEGGNGGGGSRSERFTTERPAEGGRGEAGAGGIAMSSAFTRSHRLQLSRTRTALENTWKEWEQKWSYHQAKQRRLHQLMRESGGGDAQGVQEDDEEKEGRNGRRKGEGEGSVGEDTTVVMSGGQNRTASNSKEPMNPYSDNNNNVTHHRSAGDDDEGTNVIEEDSEMAEIRRERALARLRWACYELGYSQEMSQRELQMLSALDLPSRAAAAKQYQDTLEAERCGRRTQGRHTYTILPNGEMMAGTLQNPQSLPVKTVEAGGGGPPVPPAGFAPPFPTSALHTSGGIFAQEVRDTLMVDRNPPTMTLKEFAEGEMALAMEQQAKEREARAAQAEEDARLGPEGVEERDRVKAAKWDDWKDDNPRYGKTSKGNYS